MRRNIIAFLLFFNGVGAALTQPGPANQNLPKTAAAKQVVAKQAPPQNSNCVGVVSNLGEKFAVKKIVGYIIFVGEEKAVPVESWHIDDLVAAKISGLLGKGIAVRRIPYRKDALASLAKPKLSRDREADFGEIIRAITAGTGCAPLCCGHSGRQLLWHD